MSKQLKVKVWKKFKLEDVGGITSTIRKGKRWKDYFKHRLENRSKRFVNVSSDVGLYLLS
jgi:hypothetical protein